jgi:hypothetical protein
MRGPAVLAAVLALGAAAVAGAATRPFASGHDTRADVPGGLDIVRVAFGLGRDGKLRGEVTMAAPWTTADLRGAGAGGPASICLRLYVTRDPTAQPPDWIVCASPARDGDGLVAKVMKDRANGPPIAVGDAVAVRPSARTVYLRFARSTIRNPAEVQFSAESVVPAAGCPAPLYCRDTGPDAPRTFRLQLHRAASAK